MSIFHWLAIAFGLLIGLWLATLWFRRKERRRKASMLDAAGRGRALEGQAPAVLERAGYRVVQAQVDLRYGFTVDGQPHEATLRADFLVERDGRRFVVEVKSGDAAKPTRRETRRQLLEYCLHYDAHGVLLLDMVKGQLSAVAFPTASPTSRAQPAPMPPPSPTRVPPLRSLFLLAFLAGAGVASSLWWAMR